MNKVAIFVSGSGSNAENIANHFNNNEKLNIECICSNNANAYALVRAAKLNIPSFVFSRDEFYATTSVIEHLKLLGVTHIVLAGFLWLVPDYLINNFIIINIHPALLPKYGGKGMYGDKVHKAVVENGETESGITIHFVNSKYDEGQIIFQAKCSVEPTDTADDVAAKVHDLEYKHFPRVIEQVILGEETNV